MSPTDDHARDAGGRGATDGTVAPVGPALGVFSLPGETRRRVGVRYGDRVADLSGPVAAGEPVPLPGAADGRLEPLLAAGPAAWERLLDWLAARGERLAARPVTDLRVHLPFAVADYVDFYASEDHVRRVGRIFRPGGDPMPPAWYRQPLGYHGRSGSVVVSGTPVRRPCGPRPAAGGGPVELGPTAKLDFEAEVGFVVGSPAPLGEPVAVDDVERHVFGVCLVNDWSARDLQRWESTPLGPFLGKSFATGIAGWVTPLAALAPARVPPPPRHDGGVDLPHLTGADPWTLELTVQVLLNGEVVASAPFRGLYWTPAQLLAHLTVNGAGLRTGDLFASGTVSGPAADACGCLLEATADGTRPIRLADGSGRGYLLDGDEVSVRASAPAAGGGRQALAEVTGRVLPAHGGRPG